MTSQIPAAAPELDFDTLSGVYRRRVDNTLGRILPNAETQPTRLHEAMRYAVMGAGKRVRPLLVYGAAGIKGADLSFADSAAAAVELVHAYSLVHDDLPAMDDDDLRRGRPTCHIEFDEATAILAGDALQAHAFLVLSADPSLAALPDRKAELIRILAHASSSAGMAGGQAIDLAAVGRALTLDELSHMHNLKTGALISAAVRMGALAGGIESTDELAALDTFGTAIGLAFQIHDDVLDVEGDTAIIGKPQGSDQESGKPTYPMLLGLQDAKEMATQKFDLALSALEQVEGDTGFLAELARYIVRRDR